MCIYIYIYISLYIYRYIYIYIYTIWCMKDLESTHSINRQTRGNRSSTCAWNGVNARCE